MPRSYQHINDYEKEILELKSQGMTLREIGKKYGFTYDQMDNFISRYNAKQRKLKAGKTINKKADHVGIMMVAYHHQFRNWINLPKCDM